MSKQTEESKQQIVSLHKYVADEHYRVWGIVEEAGITNAEAIGEMVKFVKDAATGYLDPDDMFDIAKAILKEAGIK